MANRTERELRKELAELRGQGSGNDTADGNDAFEDSRDLSVEWRPPAPDERPEGMGYDPSEGVLAYDAWSAQQDTLAALAGDADSDHDTGHDLVALLAGYGSGKSVLGARWLLAQALEYPGSHFLAMGTTFSEARTSTFPKLFAQLPSENTTLRTASFNGLEQSPLVADYNR